MSQLNRDPNSDPHTMNNGLAVQNGICTVCGARIGNVNICPNCGAQQSRNPYAAGMANRSVQPGQALYSYCKVMLTLTAQWEKTADENAATDEELLNWVKIDYEKKTGIAVYPEYVSKSDDA